MGCRGLGSVDGVGMGGKWTAWGAWWGGGELEILNPFRGNFYGEKCIVGIHLSVSPSLFPCARYPGWDTPFLVHGTPVPYGPCWIVCLISVCFDRVNSLGYDCFKHLI